jgi:hypothetical protein
VARELLAGPASPSRDPDSVRRAAHQILAQPQFRTTAPSLIDRARHWLGQQASKLLDETLSGHLSVIGAAVLVLIVGLLVWLIVRAIRSLRADPAARGPAVASTRRPPADWLAEAAACEAGGDWRGALRARYRALVAELSRRGLVDEIPGRTTGEYRAEVTANLPGAAAEFGTATDLFEGAVYGDRPAGPDETGEIRELAARVLEGAG